MIPSFVLNICNLGWHCFEMNPLYQTCIMSNHSSCLLPDGQVFCSMANIWLPVNNAVNDIRIYSDSWRCLCLQNTALYTNVLIIQYSYIIYVYKHNVTQFVFLSLHAVQLCSPILMLRKTQTPEGPRKSSRFKEAPPNMRHGSTYSFHLQIAKRAQVWRWGAIAYPFKVQTESRINQHHTAPGTRKTNAIHLRNISQDLLTNFVYSKDFGTWKTRSVKWPCSMPPCPMCQRLEWEPCPIADRWAKSTSASHRPEQKL